MVPTRERIGTRILRKIQNVEGGPLDEDGCMQGADRTDLLAWLKGSGRMANPDRTGLADQLEKGFD